MQTEGTVHVNEWNWDRMGLSGTKSVGGATTRGGWEGGRAGNIQIGAVLLKTLPVFIFHL